ncbi:hypothetical protein [Bradyrhizobium sp. 174]|uniref:hypothetical protein n=1 Tax=Bradyrhizobium sp. 174 TaxID=2782645 RepID=UPI001FF9E967|nr:hypothetical protein [Bradyrhizobium sp. 174]MCK1577807.1 hypothetical protein [Bradyrhizobium sp. 174]
MAKFSLPEQFKIVEALAPAADAAGRASIGVSLKNYSKAWLLVTLTQGNAATVAIAVNQATNVAKAGGKALANAARIWANLDTSLTDTLVRQADAVSFTTDAALKNKQVLIEVDPAALDVAGGFDCVYMSTGASNAANITQAQWILSGPRFASATPPSAIVD